VKSLSLVMIALILIGSFLILGCSTSNSPTTIQSSTTTPAGTVNKPVTTTASVTTIPPSTTTASAPPSSSVKPSSTSTGTPAPTGASAQQYGGKLRIIEANFPGEPIGWMKESTVYSGQMPAMEMLIAEQMNGDFSPMLAASWDIVNDPNNPSITFHLQKGVKFHDGTDFNAQAMKWNLEQVKSGTTGQSAAVYWKKMTVVDDYTLRVDLSMWTNLAVRSFTNLLATAVSPTAYDKNGVDYMRFHMIGTGPFKQTKYVRDVTLQFAKNTDYWQKGKPYLDGIDMLYVVDSMTRLALFKSGGADIMNIFSNPMQSSQLAAEGYQLLVLNSGPDILSPDSLNADSPWANQKVREAAEYAIDKQSMANTLGYGYRPAAYQFPVPTSKAFLSDVPGRKYDVAKAKQLLTEAKYPNGFKTSIIAQNTVSTDILVAIQAFLSKVGIQADLQIMDATKYTTTWTSSWHNALMYAGTGNLPSFNAIMNNNLGLTTSSLNNKCVKRPDGWDNMLMASYSTPSPDPVLMQKLNRALYDNCTVIPIWYGGTMYTVTDKVHDTGLLTRGTFTQWNPGNAWLSK
jgi:peptide/nickel transport system substrate-binding protein